MILRDLWALARHYRGLFGIRGWWLLAERSIRSILPVSAHRRLARAIWLKEPIGAPSFVPSAVPVPETGKSLQYVGPADEQLPLTTATLEGKLRAARQIRDHVFDFLGTGPRSWSSPVDWHLDVNSGYRWPLSYYSELHPVFNTTDTTDGKIPYELSRLHHLVTLGQAWWLTGDEEHATEFFSQWESWMESNPWPFGVNWTSPMEAAIRAVNLMWAAALLDRAPGWTLKRKTAIGRCLWQHGVYIEHNIEVGAGEGKIVAANHYLANLCGLATMGLCCDGMPEAERWAQVGLVGLEQEMRRQVLPDGFYFESSTSYHRLALELFLLPALVARRRGHEMSEAYWKGLEKMLEAVLYLTGPDGSVPQIGDNDDGRLLVLSGYNDWSRCDYRYLLALGAVLFQRGDFKHDSLRGSGAGPGQASSNVGTAGAVCPEEVLWLLGQRGVEQFDVLDLDATPVGPRGLPYAGLYAIRSADNQDYALVRTSTIGVPGSSVPSGHAHNDALAVELWSDGRSLWVDPGTFCYTSDIDARNTFRSTSAHNTVMMDGREINGIPASEAFSLGQEASVRVSEWNVGETEVRLVAEHDGYGRLDGPVRHRRTVDYDSSARRWLVTDELDGSGKHTATFRWHGPPGEPMYVETSNERGFEARAAGARVFAVVESEGGAWSYDLDQADYSPGYGRREPALCLKVAVQFEGNCSLSWSVHPQQSPEESESLLTKDVMAR